MADWAQQNPKAFLFIASTISAIAVAILAVNFAMAANPFTLIAIGIGAVITGLAIAYTKFEGFRNIVNTVLNGLIKGFELFANSFIGAINLIIRGINLVNPFADLASLPTINLGQIGGGSSGPAAVGSGAAREGGTGNIGSSLPTMPAMPDVIKGGGSGGGGGGGGAPLGVQGLGGANVNALTTFGNAERIAARGDTITVNVNGGLATGAQIGQAVYNSLLQYKQVYGTLDAIVA